MEGANFQWFRARVTHQMVVFHYDGDEKEVESPASQESKMETRLLLDLMLLQLCQFLRFL